MKEQLDRIEAKLDRVIKAMQEYDGLDENFNEPEDEYAWKHVNPADAEKYNRLFDEVEVNKQVEVIEPKSKRKYYHNKKKK
jgi:hypothetical protein